MQDKDKKPNVIAIIGAVVLLILAVVGLSYAYFSAFVNGGEDDTTIEGTGAKLSLVYTDGKSVITSSNIMPGWSATKTFTVKNNGEGTAYYKLKIFDITNEFVEGGLTFSIASEDGGTNIKETSVGTEDRTISSAISINVGVTHTYTVTAKYVNLEMDQTPDLGKSFSYTIGIEAAKEELILSEQVVKRNPIKVALTTPGSAISTKSEALLASTEDDYGTSYYFRGAVDNNYVQFANMCWRIVRIAGDGTTKLVLHNNNSSGVTNPCSSSNNSENAAFTGTDAMFNSNYNDNAYVGFMYGARGVSNYNSTHTNTNKSTILSALETWYNANLVSYEEKIADTIWCADKTNVTDTSFDPGYWRPSGLGYNRTITYYGATQRLVNEDGDAGGTGPTLKCTGELSEIQNKIGLLSADEVAFAGYAAGLKSTNVYLQENATGNWWWVLSPYNYNGYNATVWNVYGDDGDFDGGNVNYAGGVRPSISLVSSVVITGEGTSEKPFVVK